VSKVITRLLPIASQQVASFTFGVSLQAASIPLPPAIAAGVGMLPPASPISTSTPLALESASANLVRGASGKEVHGSSFSGGLLVGACVIFGAGMTLGSIKAVARRIKKSRKRNHSRPPADTTPPCTPREGMSVSSPRKSRDHPFNLKPFHQMQGHASLASRLKDKQPLGARPRVRPQTVSDQGVQSERETSTCRRCYLSAKQLDGGAIGSILDTPPSNLSPRSPRGLPTFAGLPSPIRSAASPAALSPRPSTPNRDGLQSPDRPDRFAEIQRIVEGTDEGSSRKMLGSNSPSRRCLFSMSDRETACAQADLRRLSVPSLLGTSLGAGMASVPRRPRSKSCSLSGRSQTLPRMRSSSSPVSKRRSSMVKERILAFDSEVLSADV